MIVPPVNGAKFGRAAGTYTQSFSFDTLQALPPSDLSGIRAVTQESLIVVPRGVGIPEMMLLATGTTTGISGTASFGLGDVTISIPSGAKISFVETVATTDPDLFTQSPLVYSHEMTAGADNTYSTSSTVVNGYIKIGVPMRIDEDPLSRVRDSTVLKKNTDSAPAVCQVSSTLAPDVGLVPRVRFIELNLIQAKDCFIVKNESTTIVAGGTGAFTLPFVVNVPRTNYVNLTEVPSISPPPGYDCVAVMLKYATAQLTVAFVQNPPQALQGQRLPPSYEGTWLCSIIYRSTSAVPVDFTPTLVFGETINPRAAVFTGLVGNRLYGQATGIACIPDGQEPTSYMCPVPTLSSKKKWDAVICSQNDAADTGSKRIEFSAVYKDASENQAVTKPKLRKRPRDEEDYASS